MKTGLDLENAQSVWAGVPELAKELTRVEFAAYAKAYCGHHARLETARRRPA